MIPIPEINLGNILYIFWIGFIAITFMYGQKIQIFIAITRLSRQLNRLKRMNQNAKDKILELMLRDNTENKEELEKEIDKIIDSFVISPNDMDPKDIVGKMEHFLDTYDNEIKNQIKKLFKNVDEDTINTRSNLAEVAIGLNGMYKYIRHLLLSSKKQKNLYLIAQLQIIFPFVMDKADAYHASIKAFSEGLTIGDGLGPLIASKLMKENSDITIKNDTLTGQTRIENREAFIIKAKGPGGNVGKPGEAIKNVVKNQKNIKLIITIDAALKFEGEKTGLIAEGIGAAIGGPGIEKYKIEQNASIYEIPLYAIVVKMSEKEAITEIDNEIENTYEYIIEKIRLLINKYTKENDKIIIAGIGNTLGIK